jgi:hypothetical protein
MWLELFAWIESFAGVSFDPTEMLDVCTEDMAFTDPFGWKSNIDIAVDDVMELLNTLEEHKLEAPDSLGEIAEVKAGFAQQMMSEIIDKVNNIKTRLNLEITKIKGLNGLRSNVELLANLIEYCKDNDMEVAISAEKFDELNRVNDNDIVNVLGIHNRDMMNIWQAVSEVSELYDYEDEDAFDNETENEDIEDDEKFDIDSL